MLGEVPVLEIAAAYREYVGLLGAAGHAVELAVLARHLAGDEEHAAEVEAALRKRECEGTVQQAAGERMQKLLAGLIGEIRDALGEGAPSSPDALLSALTRGSQHERDAAADAVLLNGHRQFLRPSHVALAAVRELLAERPEHGVLALVKVVPHVRHELARRGFEVPEEEINQWFDGADANCQVPSCLQRIVAGLGPEFRTGLVALSEMVGEQDPDQWLEAARVKLQFRSHSAMHKAIAEATSLKYDCVHKSLSGRKKAKRIQAEIKYCLERWLRERDGDQGPSISEDYRGVPVQKMHALMVRLECRYATKEDIYRLISERTSIKTGSVRRYFQSNGQLKYAPLAVFRCAESLAAEDRQATAPQQTYLADVRTMEIARELARKANDALVRWQGNGRAVENELAFKELRRALIVTMKERRFRAPVLACVG